MTDNSQEHPELAPFRSIGAALMQAILAVAIYTRDILGDAGLLEGHATVAEAITHADCRRAVEACATAIAKWIAASEGDFAFTDTLEEEIAPVRAPGSVGDLAALLDEDLGQDEQFVALVQQKTQTSRK